MKIDVQLNHILANFLSRHHELKRPLLLAFSGGPDSLALLHLLLQYRQRYSLDLALAHVDHGWRPESADEAKQIELMAEKLFLPIHLKKLDPVALKGNLEEACREERLKFFNSLCAEHGYQAVLLAHHADDLAETVLKRTLEGASLPYLGGIRPVTSIGELQVWRPLLTVTKKELLLFLESLELKGFHDNTNEDTRFMRGKLRMTILPQLSKEFGKEISSNLCQIGRDSIELREYLNQQVAPYLAKKQRNVIGSFLDLSDECPKSIIELKHLIRLFCEEHAFTLSREAVESAALMLLSGAANKQVNMGSHSLLIDRRCLFMPENLTEKPIPYSLMLEANSSIQYGLCKIQVSETDLAETTQGGWRALWQGGLEVVLPKGKYSVAMPRYKDEYQLQQRKVPLTKWWSDHKVPTFLRYIVPLILEDGVVRHEFLTGKKSVPSNEYCPIKIRIVL